MKKLLSMALLATTICASKAQDHHVYTFLKPEIYSITVSNTYSFTNLDSFQPTGTGQGTNILGNLWTNVLMAAGTNLGQRMLVAAANAGTGTNLDLATYNVFQDAPLWVNRTADPVQSITAGLAGVTNYPVYHSIMIRLAGKSGANAAVNFIFSAVPDGTNETTAAGNTFTVGVTANTTSPVCIYTNLPAYQFSTAKKIRLRSVTNTDTDATSDVQVYQVSLIGFQP